MSPASLEPGHPPPEELQQFLLGDLPEPDLERLAQHLEACPLCLQALPGAVPADGLVEALRRPLEPEVHAADPECAETIERLATRLSSLPSSAPAGPAAADTGDAHYSTQSYPRAPSTKGPGAAGQPLPDVPHDPFAGGLPCTFGRYQILERLGKGGMGTVYLARDTTLDRRVALKVCQRAEAADTRLADRFLREARAAAGLHHEGICRVLDYGVQEGIPYLTMDYIQGRPLSQLLAASQPLEPGRVAGLVQRVALALDSAHRQGVIHRDLKPANIMLDENDQPCVVDFGLARREQDPAFTRPGTVVGTPAYMSPEQVNGEPVDQRTDIYSLGVILYELLTGRRPYRGDTTSQLMYQIAHGKLEPPSRHRPDLDPRLEAICLQALAKAADARPATMGELAAALDAYRTTPAPAGAREPNEIVPPVRSASEGIPSQALRTGVDLSQPGETGLPPSSPTEPPTEKSGAPGTPVPGRRRWLAGALLAAVAIGALGSVVFLVLSGREAPQAAPPFKGWIDVRVWEEGNRDRLGLRLNQPDALPLKAQDRIRVAARLNRPGYLYVFWIDAAGVAQPVYPWKPGHWDQRPEQEEPVSALDLPPDSGEGWEIEQGTAGMETLVMLVRETPLSRIQEKELRALLADLPEQHLQHAQAAVWFENGAVVHDEAERGPNLFNARKIDDPVVQTQRLLRKKLAPLCAYSRAVSFANKGK